MKIQQKKITFSQLLVILCTLFFIVSCSDNQEDTNAIVQSHFDRSKAYEEQGQYRASIIEARNIVNKDRDNNLGYQRLAELFLTIGNFRGASSLLETIPSNTQESLLLLTEAYIGQRKLTSAEKSLTNYESIGGDIAAIDYKILKSKILAGRNKLSVAKESLEGIISKSPDHVEAKNLLASIYFSEQSIEKAQKIVSSTLETNPTDPSTLYLAAQMSYLENNLPEAEKLLTDALLQLNETDIILPLRSQVLRQLSEVLTEQGRTSEALIYSKVLAAANPEANEARAKFTNAIKLLQSGNITEAESELQQLNTLYPNNDLSSLYLGLINYQQGDLEGADLLLSGRVDAETASPKLIETSVLTKLRLQKNDEAFELLEAALKTYPDNVELLSIYGIALLQTNTKQQEATIALEKAIALNPKNNRLRLALANYYLSNQQVERGIAQLQQAKKISPENVNVIAAYAQAMIQNDNKPEADKTITQLLKKKPNDPEVLNLNARYALSNGQRKLAAEQYKKTLAQDKNNQEALLLLGSMAINERQGSNALSYYQRFIEVNPNDPRGYKGLVAAYEMNKEPQKGLASLENFVKKDSSNLTAIAVTAEYFLRKNNISKAQDYIDIGFRSGETNDYLDSVAATIKFTKAREAAQSQDWDQARKNLLEAIELTPNNEQLYSALIQIEFNSQRYDEAKQLIDDISKQFPNSLMPVLAKAKYYADTNNKDKAIEILQNSWKERPTDNIAEALLTLINDNKTARSALINDWLQTSPNNTRPIILAALDAQQKGSNQLAIDLYEKANSIRSDNPAVLNNLAWLYSLQKSGEKAEKIAKQAYELAPENPGIMDTYGWILANNGKIDKGIKILEKAANAAPDNAEILDHLNAARDM